MCDSVPPPQAGELSVKLDPYIRTQRTDGDGESAETRMWPLIKHIEVTLPRSALIPEGVVLVDIPGTGDFNSKRDEMWKKVILFSRASFLLPSTLPRFLSNGRYSAFSLRVHEFFGIKFFCLPCTGREQCGTWVATEITAAGITDLVAGTKVI